MSQTAKPGSEGIAQIGVRQLASEGVSAEVIHFNSTAVGDFSGIRIKDDYSRSCFRVKLFDGSSQVYRRVFYSNDEYAPQGFMS